MLRYVGGVVVAVVVLAGCGTDSPASTVTPTPATSSPGLATGSATPGGPAGESTQDAATAPVPELVVPPVSPGEPVELQFPPLSEQPAPGTSPGTSSESTSIGEITCETVCTSTGCEQYQYSVLGCP